ncbi:MAG: hypothetical protein RLZZ337_496 [Bacteroidota bacterium]|jgi:hypothetical protein
MNIKQITILGSVALAAIIGTMLFSSFTSSKSAVTEYKTITTIESLIPMGLGRSRMLISDKDGTTEKDMQNFFSGVGINFKNIGTNSELINQTLNYYAEEGWELESTSTGVQGSNENAQGLFITRYFLVKEAD